jgi:hypothetical protein
MAFDMIKRLTLCASPEAVSGTAMFDSQLITKLNRSNFLRYAGQMLMMLRTIVAVNTFCIIKDDCDC